MYRMIRSLVLIRDLTCASNLSLFSFCRFGTPLKIRLFFLLTSKLQSFSCICSKSSFVILILSSNPATVSSTLPSFPWVPSFSSLDDPCILESQIKKHKMSKLIYDSKEIQKHEASIVHFFKCGYFLLIQPLPLLQLLRGFISGG